ncbi:MAG: prepilin-type N-terminal cleavage/methylation domain-containing protein [Coriobacteriia bacterium]|nr:prepilin-type N-terminal cleavage/methylation domain-containing protein [Coriobacteriia bacterium]
MKEMIKKMREDKGFTLAELLIVVAIIAVLVAIAIPIFTAQLEKARESTDAANIRDAYAEVMTAALTESDTAGNVTRTGTAGSYVWTATVTPTQAQADWQNDGLESIGGLKVGNNSGDIEGITSGQWTITYTSATDTVAITPTKA